MPEAAVRAAMGQPDRTVDDLAPYSDFSTPPEGTVLCWAANGLEIHAILDARKDALMDVLVARTGTRKAVSLIGTKAEVLGETLKPGTDESEIIRLIGPPDRIGIWPAGMNLWPEMEGKLVLQYFGIRTENSSIVFFIDPDSHKLLKEASSLVTLVTYE